MKCFDYTFSTHIEYQRQTPWQDFLLRVIPANEGFQKLNEFSLDISGCENYTCHSDGFGNTLEYGRINTPKSFFNFSSKGNVTQTRYLVFGDCHPMYRHETLITKASDKIIDFYLSLNLDENSCVVSKTKKICQGLSKIISYEKGITKFETSAKEAFELKKGVCQDFAQIAICVCKLAKIPARYVNGLMIGEGQSHAWIEVWDNYKWYGFDPTNNCQIDYGYIKISHGRDSQDCPLNKGIIACISKQNITTNVKVFQRND